MIHLFLHVLKFDLQESQAAGKADAISWSSSCLVFSLLRYRALQDKTIQQKNYQFVKVVTSKKKRFLYSPKLPETLVPYCTKGECKCSRYGPSISPLDLWPECEAPRRRCEGDIHYLLLFSSFTAVWNPKSLNLIGLKMIGLECFPKPQAPSSIFKIFSLFEIKRKHYLS